MENKRTAWQWARTSILMATFCGLPSFSSFAEPMDKLNMEAAAEYKFSHFKRDPEPALTSGGNNFSQEYKLYLNGELLRGGFLDSSAGVLFPDKYRTNDVDFENHLRYDYNRWLELESLTLNETDEDIFFSGTAQLQSPIHTLTQSYKTKTALGALGSLEYRAETIKRNDVLLGTVMDEETKSERTTIDLDNELIRLNGEYGTQDFKDALGLRSDISSEEKNVEVSYDPADFFNTRGYFEDSKDKDLDKDTKLSTKEQGIESSIKPIQEFELRHQLRLRENKDTQTGEDIQNRANEITAFFDPHKRINFEVSYEKQNEDKTKNSIDIVSTIEEKDFKMQVIPLNGVNIESGYEISDKTSSSTTENSLNKKMYSDISLEPHKALRLGGNFSHSEQKNTYTELVEAKTNSLSSSLHYRPIATASLFLSLDTSKTDNPSTNSFTKTDTLSSNLSVEPNSFSKVTLRTSRQETGGSSESADSSRLLNALEFNIELLKNLSVSTEYEMIAASGANASDENLFDTSFFYNAGRFDFSLRFQNRVVSGATPIDKTAILSNLQYEWSKNAVMNLKLSLSDYTDELTEANNYQTLLFESSVALKF